MGLIGRAGLVTLALIATSCGNGSDSPTATSTLITTTSTTEVPSSKTTAAIATIPITPTLPPLTTTVAPCTDPLLSVLPVAVGSIGAVVPLGNLNPPSHTQPTDHIYFWLSGHETGWPSEEVPLVAPANGTVTRVAHSTSITESGEFSDWSVTIELCPGREVKFGHVSSLAAEIENSLSDHQRCHEYGYDNEWYVYCDISTSVAVVAGQTLGTAGGRGTLSIALDMWATDWTLDPASFVNEEAIHDGMRHAVCPLDWYDDDLGSLLYMLTEGATGVPLAESVGCGTVAQDRAGTAKGLWYLVAGVDGEWQDQLALVDDNARAIDQAIAVSSTVADPGVWVFERRHDGKINRDFAEVTAGSGTWCYGTFAGGSSGNSTSDRFVLEVVEQESLLIERQLGACGATWEFVDPVNYRR